MLPISFIRTFRAICYTISFFSRAFTVWEENPAVDLNAEVAEQRLLKEYNDKLIIGEDVVPDPYTLSSGWLGEKKGLNY
ncbi:hypothetical protein DPMN_014215 [Dreissena polymorpha]|uniref:Uncharacterized protein n=1 Tax=Dreissena polymorpha TaxID=45954 RepID=A0A9D4S4G7_DREPO|nr:hypothetical protein DPMN_014215 [Dreissena polymorpha]